MGLVYFEGLSNQPALKIHSIEYIEVIMVVWENSKNRFQSVGIANYDGLKLLKLIKVTVPLKNKDIISDFLPDQPAVDFFRVMFGQF